MKQFMMSRNEENAIDGIQHFGQRAEENPQVWEVMKYKGHPGYCPIWSLNGNIGKGEGYTYWAIENSADMDDFTNYLSLRTYLQESFQTSNSLFACAELKFNALCQPLRAAIEKMKKKTSHIWHQIEKFNEVYKAWDDFFNYQA